jgi:hypothetical protein
VLVPAWRKVTEWLASWWDPSVLTRPLKGASKTKQVVLFPPLVLAVWLASLASFLISARLRTRYAFCMAGVFVGGVWCRVAVCYYATNMNSALAAFNNNFSVSWTLLLVNELCVLFVRVLGI